MRSKELLDKIQSWRKYEEIPWKQNKIYMFGLLKITID